MSRGRFTLWALMTWVTPAVLAGALGWPGIWGGGSAFTDLILPLPITGGVFHIPSFLAALFLVWAYQRIDDAPASIVRAALAAAALVGLSQLIDLERLYLSVSTDLPFRGVSLERSYIGLCLFTDALWALVWTVRRPALQRLWGLALPLVVVPPVLSVLFLIARNDRLTGPFVHGRSQPTQTQGDGLYYVYARIDMSSPGSREAAVQFVAEHRPEEDFEVEDLAVFFTDSLATARSAGGAPARLTLCLFEDGTPDQWHEGEADCFGAHTTFTDRLTGLGDRMPDQIPRDIWTFAIANELCPGVVTPDPYYGGIAAVDYCRNMDLAEQRAELERQYPPSELAGWLTSARESF